MINKNKNLFYVSLIFLVWLAAYLICNFVWEQKLGWDEVAYLSVAKGIAKDFDFSSRAYSVMGILKYGYPTNLINFPVFSFYLAIFLKLFGATIHAAYFSTWLSALGVCILTYFIFLLISDKDHKLAFFVSMLYLFFPGILKNCDNAMMEQGGCFLLCLSVFLILKDFVKGKFGFSTVLKFAFSFLVLWLYKSLFVGYFVGAFIFICFAYKFKDKKLDTKIPLPVFLFLSYGIFAFLYFIVMKFVFLPVAPMMNFTIEQENSQVYADFLGGFFTNFPDSLIANLRSLFLVTIASYFIYPTINSPYAQSILLSTSNYVLVGLYFFFFFLMIVFAFGSWKKISSTGKMFLLLVFVTILSFNLIFNVLFFTGHGNIWRYNVYSLPLYLCCLALLAKANFDYVKPFIAEHVNVFKTLILLFFLLGYLPLFMSSISHYLPFEQGYHNQAKRNSEVAKYFIKNPSPIFIYYNDGSHITWDMYPVKQIFKDATNEQLLEVNKILPEPIEYLFLKPSDWLFKNNRELIAKGEPILNGRYELYGFNEGARIVVYKYK